MRRLVQALLRREIVRFVVTGVAAAVLFAVLCDLALRSALPAAAGTLAAYATTVTASYTVQRGWTFGGRHRHGRAFPRYVAAQVGCAAVTAAAAQLLAGRALAPASVAAAVTVLGSALSFGLSRFWVFPARRAI